MLEASKNSRSAVRARRGAGAGAGRCVELDPALMTVTLTRGAGHYTEEGNTIKVGALYTQLRLDSRINSWPYSLCFVKRIIGTLV